MARPSIAAVIPTFNEVEVLRQAVDSLLEQEYPNLTVFVVNAGDPLPEDFRAKVQEIPVPSDFYWTMSIGRGFEVVKERGFDFVLMLNADTAMTTGSLELLLAEASKPNTVACSPAYMRQPDGTTELMYSGEKFHPLLFHFRLQREWDRMEDAPKEPYETAITGGQGVMFDGRLLQKYSVDPARFPHNKGDFDLWLSMKRDGIRLMMVPAVGAINLRAFGEHAKQDGKIRLKKLWARATDIRSNDSWPIMWQIRRKHQPLPLALLSFALMYPWRQVKGVVDTLRPPSHLGKRT